MSATRQRIPARGFAAVAVEDPGTPFRGGGNIPARIAAVTAGTRWEAVLAVEGEPTEDGRLLAPGSVTWRELPLSLMAQTETQPGHDGAEVAGRIDNIWRDGNRIMGSGVFDGGEYGTMIAELVRGQTLRGVSVDLAVREFELQVQGEAVDPEFAEADALYVVTDGVIGAATVCSFQAIEQATITIVGSSNDQWRLHHDGAWTFPGPTLDDRLAEAYTTLTRTADLAGQRDSAEKRASDMERLVATGTFAHMTEMQKRLEESQAREAEMARLVTEMQENHQTETEAQKVETLALMASLTERISAGEKISESLIEALGELTAARQPRTVKVVRGEDGRPSAYEVA